MNVTVLASLLVLAALTVAGAPADEPEACRPATRFTTAPWWTSRLAETRSRILKEKGACYDLVLVGDSITHRWENKTNGKEGLVWLDMGEKFLDETGEIRSGLMMPDNLHPIAAGYEIWLAEMCPVVDRMLARDGFSNNQKEVRK